MAINKVKYGNNTLIDLTGTTATSDKILTGYGAFGRDGVWMDGSLVPGADDGYVYQDEDNYVVLDDDEGVGVGVTPLSVTSNGTYNAGTRRAYNPVTVNVANTYTATIFNNGNANYCYVEHGGVKYYTNMSTFTFKSGDIIYFKCQGQDIWVNTVKVSGSEYTMDVVPNTNIEIYLTYNSSSNNSIVITYPFTPTVGPVIVTATETAQQIVPSDWDVDYFSDVMVDAIPSNYVGSAIPRKSSTDLTASGATVTVPAGYYSGQASKSVTSMTLPTATATTATGTNKATIGRSTATRYINIPTGYNSASAYYTISSTPNGTATTPATTITTNPTISVNSSGLITATNSKTQSVTPTVSAGYVSTGTAGTITVSGSATSQLTTKGATTYTPTTSNQTIASGTYLTGTQTISGDSNLVASNIKKDVTIFGITGTAETEPSLVAKTVTPTAQTQIVLPEEEELVGNYIPTPSEIQLYSQGGEELVTPINKGYYIVDTTTTYSVSTTYLPLKFRVTVNFQEARRSSQGTTVFATKTVEGEGTITSTTGFDVTVNDDYVQKFIVRPYAPNSSLIYIQLYVLFSNISYSTTTFNNIHVVRTDLYLKQEYDGLSQVTVNGDADLIAENIKKDVNIFGVTGTYEGGKKYYATITSAGEDAWSYVKYPGSSGAQYYELNDTFEIEEGQIIQVILSMSHGTCYVYVNDVPVANSGQDTYLSYSYTVPACTNVSIDLTTTRSGTAYLTEEISVINITEDGLHNVSEYDYANVNVSSGGLDELATHLILNDFSTRMSVVTIPSNISEIGPYGFMGKTLREVSGDSVNYIRNSGFQTCQNLRTVIFPNVTSLGLNAFAYCTQLSSVSLPSVITMASSRFAYCASLSSVNFPNVTSLGPSAFAGCSSLTDVLIPKLRSAGSYAFANCYKLPFVSFPLLTVIPSSMFQSCSALLSVYIPSVTYVNDYAFRYASSLESISFPYATQICAYTFANCSRLSNIYLPSVSILWSGAFASDISLTSIDFPEVFQAMDSCFASCRNLTTVSMPKLATVGSNAFNMCSALSSIVLPQAATVYYAGFSGCYSLNTVVLGNIQRISSYAFRQCYNLLSLYLIGESMVSFSTAMFSSTPISNYTTSTGGVYGSIFVPASLYNSYVTATNWSLYSSRFVSLTDAQISAILNS